MLILALESSCDETSAAVIRDGAVLANVVSSQTKMHAEYGGVVPELAVREHIRNLQPVTLAALAEAGVTNSDASSKAIRANAVRISNARRRCRAGATSLTYYSVRPARIGPVRVVMHLRQ